MTALRITLALPLLLVAACNTRDEGNTTVISVDENQVEAGIGTVGNVAGTAADEAGEAIRIAGPVIENTADTIGERAGRVADKAENAVDDVDVDVTVDNRQ